MAVSNHGTGQQRCADQHIECVMVPLDFQRLEYGGPWSAGSRAQGVVCPSIQNVSYGEAASGEGRVRCQDCLQLSPFSGGQFLRCPPLQLAQGRACSTRANNLGKSALQGIVQVFPRRSFERGKNRVSAPLGGRFREFFPPNVNCVSRLPYGKRARNEVESVPGFFPRPCTA
jgi:hypothetical protein